MNDKCWFSLIHGWTKVREGSLYDHIILKSGMKTWQNNNKSCHSAIIKLLRKGDKNPLLSESYRHISLLSIFYKLASCCITRQIKPVVELLIGKQQKAYITSNNIGSCILDLVNMINHVNEKRKAALILLIDF